MFATCQTGLFIITIVLRGASDGTGNINLYVICGFLKMLPLKMSLLSLQKKKQQALFGCQMCKVFFCLSQKGLKKSNSQYNFECLP